MHALKRVLAAGLIACAAPALTAQEQPIVFGNDTLVDFSAGSGEPFIRVGPRDTPVADNVYVSAPFGVSTTVSLLWRSIDGGSSFIPLGSPITRDAVTGPGGGDTHQDFDAMGRVYYTDLSAACVMAAVSEDGGNTFLPHQTNHLTCIGGGENVAGVTDDRQWIAAFGDGLGYVTSRNFASGGFHLFRTRDAGVTWHGQAIGSVGQSGPLEIDKTKRLVNGRPAILLYQIATGLKMFRITDFDDGTAPTVVERTVVSTPNTLFPILTVDSAGNLYVVWATGGNIFMRTSQDRGDTWSATTRVNSPAMTGTNIMPWVVAGDPGRIDVIWYRTPGANNAGSSWNLYFAQSLNALSATPTFTETKVSQTTIHKGEICLDGLNCDISTLTGSPRDRGFLEFPSIDVDSRGAAVMTFNDNTNQADGPGRPGGTYVMVTRQTAGPSVYAAVGNVGADPGSVTVTEPASGATLAPEAVTLAGTHTLPGGGIQPDAAGDALFPDHGPVPGLTVPALDLRGVRFANDATSLTVTFDVADATLPALAAAPIQSGGDGILYLAQWDYNDVVYWVGAELRGGQPVYSTGTLGVIKSATSKKYVTYNPDLMLSQQVTGTISNTAPGSISIRLPRSLVGSPPAGAALFTASGYAMSERGPLVPVGNLQGNPNPASLPIQVDASAPFTYRLDTPVGGTVEVSLDPAFTSVTPAAATSDGRWSLALDNLAAGPRTAYVRQRISNRHPSPVTSVAFVVNRLPTAALSATPVSGLVPLTVAFDASGSVDPDGGPIAEYTFDPGDGSGVAARIQPAFEHVYTRPGTFTATLSVTDQLGGSSAQAAEQAVSVQAASPDPFTFVERPGVATGVFVTSEAKLLAGFDGALSIRVENGQYSLDGGAYTSTAGTAAAGQALRVRHVSASAAGASTTTTIHVGGYTTTFKSTTSALDRTPNAFGFATQTGVELNTEIISNEIEPEGYNTAVSVVAGPGASYRINGGAWATASGTLNPGDRLQTKHTSGGTSLAYKKTYLKVGGVAGYFTTRTH